MGKENYLDKHRENVATTERRIQGAEALKIALKHLTGGRPVLIEGVPLEELVATEMGLENAGRIGGNRQVKELLEVGDEVLGIALDEQKSRRADSLSMLSHPEADTTQPREQIH